MEEESMAQRFKDTFSYKDVTVHFVGAWYVSAIQDSECLCADDMISGTLFRLLGLRVVMTCFLGQLTG
jgi:hypothetical protein